MTLVFSCRNKAAANAQSPAITHPEAALQAYAGGIAKNKSVPFFLRRKNNISRII